MAAAPPQMMTKEDLAPRPKRNDGSSLTAADIQKLKDSISGKVVVKGEASDEDYKTASDRWNHFFQLQPYIVTFPETEGEISTVLHFVAKHNLDLAIAGGRHSYHGASSIEGGLVIDLQNFRDVKVDRQAQTVTAGGGCMAGDLEVPAAKEGLHVVFGAVNDTGIGGLSLGGGVGMLSGQYGLAVDNILGARVVLANGDVVVANEKENADLFWAIRGGGSNFGIVTEFEFRAHPHRQEGGLVYFAILMFAPPMIPDIVSITNKLYDTAVIPSKGRFGLMTALICPPGAPSHMPAALVFYDGPEEEAKTLGKPLFDLGPMNVMGGMQPYTATTNMHKMFPEGESNRHSASGTMLDFPFDEALVLESIDYFQKLVQAHGDALKKSVYIIEARISTCGVTSDRTVMAYASRYPNAAVVGPNLQWGDPDLDDMVRDETKKMADMIRDGLKKRRDAAIVNGEVINGGVKGVDERELDAVHPTLNTGDTKIRTMFGPNLAKLRQLKKKFDPDSLFDKWYYITPADD